MALFKFPDFVEPAVAVVTGYHGTRAHEAQSIVAEQRIVPSCHSYDWLGDGAYFWQDHELRAWRWARERFPGESIGVVKAPISLGTCLDVPSEYFDELLLSAHAEFERRCTSEGRLPPRNKGKNHALERAVFNFLCENMDRAVDTVRSIYPEGKELFPGSSQRSHSHIHLCVRTPGMIGRIELVGTEQAPPNRLPETLDP